MKRGRGGEVRLTEFSEAGNWNNEFFQDAGTACMKGRLRMIIAVNICPGENLKATLEETARRLGRARRHAQAGAIYPVRVFGPRWTRERDCPVLQYRLATGKEGRASVWSEHPRRLFHALESTANGWR